MGFMFCDLHVSLNNPSSGDINSSNLPCFPFKSFVKVELSYVFTINLFTIAENCTEK